MKCVCSWVPALLKRSHWQRITVAVKRFFEDARGVAALSVLSFSSGPRRALLSLIVRLAWR